MTISTFHLFILLQAKMKPIPYHSIRENQIPDYDYLIDMGYLDVENEAMDSTGPQMPLVCFEPKTVSITPKGKAVFSTYIREQLLVWLGILIDFILALVALII